MDAVEEATAAIQGDEPVHHHGIVSHKVFHESLWELHPERDRRSGKESCKI